MNHFCIRDCKHSKELIGLDFPENLIIGRDDCKVYLEHCNHYNMKFLKHSYGTLVHKNFDNYLEYIPIRNDEDYEIQQKLSCSKGLEGDYNVDGVNLPLDHVNLFKSKMHENTYILTSSPYNGLSKDILKTLKQYPFDSYIINPNFLDYHGFADRVGKVRPPLWDVNYAFTNAKPEVMLELNKLILNELSIFLAFDYLM